MTKIVVGLFDNMSQARDAVRDLSALGYDQQNISLITYRADEPPAGDQDAGPVVAEPGMEGPAQQLETDFPLLLRPLVIPGTGAALGSGPLAEILASTEPGAGGITPTLEHIGIPKFDANLYAEGLRRGGALVLVQVEDDKVEPVLGILNRRGAVDLDDQALLWHGDQGPVDHQPASPFAYDPNTQTFREREPASQLDYGPGADTLIPGQPVSAYDRSQADLGKYKDDALNLEFVQAQPHFYKDFEKRYGVDPDRWKEARDMYFFGFEKGRDERFAAADWDLVRDTLRVDWEERYPDLEWEMYQDAVYEGWRIGRKS